MTAPVQRARRESFFPQQKVEATMHSTEDAAPVVNSPMGTVVRPRQIILGCDGTNNTLTGGSHDTNVLKLIGQLAPEDGDHLLYYDPGVGSADQLPSVNLANYLHRKWQRIAGLANGRGIYENIAETYLFLVDHYRPGDQIYIVGFSRGAFTARAVAGMINLFGIVTPHSRSLILTLIRVYFSTPGKSKADMGFWPRRSAKKTVRSAHHNQMLATSTAIASPGATPAQITHYLAHIKTHRNTREEIASQVRATFASADGACAPIHFVGVWDTVESVGMIGLQRKITSNGGTRDKPQFRHIRHALSLDEHRRTFAPRLYWDDDYDENAGDPATGRSLRQRWFRGVHSDVGGGYAEREAGLSDQAYHWMLGEAVACGLRVAPAQAAQVSKPLIAHDPCYGTPWWGVAGLTARSNITHVEEGSEKTIPVTNEGAAKNRGVLVHSVWMAVLQARGRGTVIALLCMAALFGCYGWLASRAIAGIDGPGLLASIGRGAMALELWQKTYVLAGIGDGTTAAGVALDRIGPAAGAMLVDFGLIAAYSWLIGLYGALAFHAMAGRRNPADPAPFYYRLGNAPMYLVIADVVENVFTLLTLWCIAREWLVISYWFGALMLVAGMVKWAGFLDTVVLLVCGIAARVRPSPTLQAGTASPPVRRRRGWRA
jgi:uncharacterized protein (DUF2235 family)